MFRDATRFEANELPSSEALREHVSVAMADQPPTAWERSYPIISAYRGDERLGEAVVVEELGKHRNMTFVVGVGMDGKVTGVAMMVYREGYGGEVRSDRFLSQYRGKKAADGLVPGRDVRNITGATLSAYAIGRGVKKAVAVAQYVRSAHDPMNPPITARH
ncbi:MAG: FMN-binding protein [Deltaproteobacteria bacterium]|nr:FMN-binding protein [Deltaproteobacteria bacterium]